MEPRFPAFAQLTGAKKIGAGGSGVVYAADHPRWGAVAVKVTNDQSEENRQLFVSEYTLLRSLQHRAILRAFAFFTLDDHRPVILTQLCAAGDLYAYAGRIELADRFRPLAGILSALEYLHGLGIVHRDLKGENILVHHAEGPKLSDFGLAAARQANNRDRGGTLEYMAPEVIDNRGARSESDIYSLGVILYRLALGRLPFGADDPLQVIAQKQKLDEAIFRDLQDLGSERFAKLVQQCLEPDPENRPKSVREVAETMALDELIERSEFEIRPIRGYLHNQNYNYLSSFCRQELKASPSHATIIHHHQERNTGLAEAVADYASLTGANVTAVGEDAIEIQATPGPQIIKFAAVASNDGAAIELPELDAFALAAILGRIFTKGIDGYSLKTIERLCCGNLTLLDLILADWEQRGWIDVKSGRLSIDPVELFHYCPPDMFVQRVASMLPTPIRQDSPVHQFVAADPGYYPLSLLTEFGLLEAGELHALVECGWIDAEAHIVRRHYYSEYIYRHSPAEQKRQSHLDWIKVIQETDELEPSIRERLKFHHFAGAGEDANAVTAAVELARLLRQQQGFDEAIAVLRQARTLPAARRDLSGFVELVLLQADLYKSVGDLNHALSCYSAAIRYGRRVGDQATVANAYKRLGDIYKGKRDYRRGSRALDHAVEFFGKTGDELELSHCFNNIGNICWIAGDLAGAEVNYETALEVQRRLGALRDTASTLSNLGTVKYLRGQAAVGIQLYKESIEIKKQMNDLPELARTYNNLSVAYFEQDDLQQAQEVLKQAYDINRRLGAQDELMYNFENFCEIEVRRGNFAETRAWAIEGLKRAKRDAHAARGNLICHLASLAITQGRYDKAAALIAAARSREQQITDRMLTMNIAVLTGDFHRVLLDPESALQSYNQAIEHGKQLTYARNTAACLIRRAQLERALNRPETETVATLEEAQRYLKDLNVKREKLELILEAASFHLACGRTSECENKLSEAVGFQDFDGIGTLRPRLYLLRGRLELQRDNPTKALSLLNDAVIGAKTLGVPELIWPSLMSLGDCYRDKHDYEKALKCFIEAFSVIRESAGFILQKPLRSRYLSDPLKRALAERLEEMSALVA